MRLFKCFVCRFWAQPSDAGPIFTEDWFDCQVSRMRDSFCCSLTCKSVCWPSCHPGEQSPGGNIASGTHHTSYIGTFHPGYHFEGPLSWTEGIQFHMASTKYYPLSFPKRAECFCMCSHSYHNFEPLISHMNVHTGRGRSWRAFLEQFGLKWFSLCTYWGQVYWHNASMPASDRDANASKW